MDNHAFESFSQELRDALIHLYDPIYRPPECLCEVLGCVGQPAASTIQEVLLSAITELKPAADAPPRARARRVYDLLSYRYVQELTQDETSERLGISPRHLRREQQIAVHVLAHWLWEQHAERITHIGSGQPQGDVELAAARRSETEWRSQVRQELASLDQTDPGAVSDVREAIDSISDLAHKMAQTLGVHVVFDVVEGDLAAKIHPTLLRQILIGALQTHLRGMRGGEILVKAYLGEGQVHISIVGGPIVEEAPPDTEFVQEAVALQGGTCHMHLTGDRRHFSIRLPHARQIVVLMIDDNEDLVHFFQRFTARTPYRIIHIGQGRAVFKAIQNIRPNLVVLDVMLPDMDGWEVLTRLHDDPDTRTIPIIVCTVIRQEELALALGAAAYLSKPVRRGELLEAFDQALARAA